ncbi:MAG: FeoB small GTPase domain-containing protein [Candidatus Omnitrophota bacterium]
MKINKILLMGNPNVGKSVIFSRLTGAKVIISNYPGTTVEFTQGYMKIGQERATVIDVPGTYTLEPTCKAEEVAVQIIPMIVALYMWDDTKHRGIHIDARKLEESLGVPVVPTCGLTGEGIKELVERLPEAGALKLQNTSDSEKWERIGKIISEVQKLTHRRHTLLERLEDLSIKPLSGLPIALVVLIRELGIKDMLKSTLIMIFVVISVGMLLNLIL